MQFLALAEAYSTPIPYWMGLRFGELRQWMNASNELARIRKEMMDNH